MKNELGPNHLKGKKQDAFNLKQYIVIDNTYFVMNLSEIIAQVIKGLVNFYINNTSG